MFLSDLSIKRPIMISMFLVVFVLFGGMAYFGMNLELTPEVNLPMVTVQTVYAGAGPQELESQITKKVEDEVASISGIDYIQSYSMESVSYVLIAFDLDKDVYLALNEVKDKIDGILNDLPDDADLPIVQRFDPGERPAVELILSGSLPITELYDVADKRLSSYFAQLPGVANVDIIGGQEREISVEFDNKTVLQHSISISQMAGVLARQNMDMPGGDFERKSMQYSVRLEGEFDDVETIRNIKVPTATGMKKLGDIANIKDTGEKVYERTTYFNNKSKKGNNDVIQLSIMKTSDGNVVNIYEAVMERLPEAQKLLPAGCDLEIVDESSTFINDTVADTLFNIILGIVLTSLILLFFLHDYKSTIIIALSMPFSIISSFLFMSLSGFSLNLMSLMGLSTSVGILVANSIVVIENIFRYKNMGEGKKESASKGTADTATAVIASTLTNLVVFLPLATMSSIAGRFFVQFSLTVVFATIFSLITSFTLTPMLASLILPDKDDKKHPIGEKLEAIFKKWDNVYKKILIYLLGNKKRGIAVLTISFILLITSLFMASTLGFEFTPSMDEGKINIQVELPSGYKLNETADVLETIEGRIKQHPEISHFWTQLGRQAATDIGTNLANLKMKLVPKAEREIATNDLIQIITSELSDIPNAKIVVRSEVTLGAGEQELEFDLIGFEMDSLEAINKGLIELLAQTPGTMNITSSSRAGKPEITIKPHRYKLDEAGITVYDIAMAIRGSMAGLVSTAYKDKGEEYDIRVKMNEETTNSPEEIRNIPVIGPKETYRLEQLAVVEFTEGYSTINHKDRMKSIRIGLDMLPGYVMGDAKESIEQYMAGRDLPNGYGVKWGMMAKELEKTTADILQAFIIAILLTYMLLAAMLESLTQPLLILGTVPLALIGVFGGLFAFNMSMNIVSMLAIVMLIGIVVNNAILILDYTNQLVFEKGMAVHDALIEACPTKLKPILMSSIAIILAMLPMAMGLGESGSEIRQPMGVVSIGGLIASTILSLLIIPVLYNVTTRSKVKNAPVKSEEK